MTSEVDKQIQLADEELSKIAGRSLGNSTSYAVYTDKSDPSLLNPMPRDLGRVHWGINGDEIGGFDRWTCHEATFLTNAGLPVAGTLVFVYSANSKYMVESKSMKMYLNTFDMCKMGIDVGRAKANYVATVKKDLEAALETKVRVAFFDTRDYAQAQFVEAYPEKSIDLCEDAGSLKFVDYTGQSEHVRLVGVRSDSPKTWLYHTNILRSRCRHTKQKDSGTATFCIRGTVEVDSKSLLRQVVSLREVNEFHELCAEKLLKSITRVTDSVDDNTSVRVALFYARRGSLDINPVRWNAQVAPPDQLMSEINDVDEIVAKTQGQ